MSSIRRSYAAATSLAILTVLPQALADDPAPSAASKTSALHAPVRLRAGSDFVRTDAPGYATPAWFDATDDGRPDLVVGQFDGGKIQIFESCEDGTLGEGKYLQAGGEVAKVPGVW